MRGCGARRPAPDATVPDVLRVLAPVLAAGLVLAACGSGDDEPAAAPVATTAPAPASSDAADGSGNPVAPAALQFSAPLIGGGDIELTTLAGRPVLLWFWAPW